jgi:hypothetical protein
MERCKKIRAKRSTSEGQLIEFFVSHDPIVTFTVGKLGEYSLL